MVDEAFTTGLCSEHFSVDGTLIESFVSAKSFQHKPQEQSGGTWLSVTDTQASPPDGNGFKPGNRMWISTVESG